ncbi:MAG TPA: biotin--[acetyl-CoA-carboxylase] ligase [Candidatus Aminicenantes bacterium]|nr:biotin--[acetyl-CoA-carboxylase] ligase [Candidatus Aminicenantes bacterium]
MELGKKVIRLPSCSSTNDVLRELAERGEEEGVAVLAEEQVAGRGTKGRTWFSPPGMGLYLSVLLRPAQESSLFPLLAGVAVVEAISEEYSLPLLIRWPNDLIWKEKKLGGILSESSFAGQRLSYVILGIGLNLNQAREDFPSFLQNTAVSLKMILHREFSPEYLASKIFPALNRWYNLVKVQGEEPILKTVERLSLFQPGETIIIETAKEKITGKFLGLDRYGRLVVKTKGATKAFSSGEIMDPLRYRSGKGKGGFA